MEDKAGSSQLEEVPFCSDEFSFVCGEKHPLTAKQKVTLEEIAEYPFFYERGRERKQRSV